MIPAAAGNIPVPVTTTHTPVVANPASVMAGNPTIGSLPLNSVPSPIALVEARNNFRGSSVPLSNSKPATAGETQQARGKVNQFLNRGLSNSEKSSAFLAQLLAQDPDSIVLRGKLSLETADPATMQVFSNIKYLPSNAAKPPLKPSAQTASALPITGTETGNASLDSALETNRSLPKTADAPQPTGRETDPPRFSNQNPIEGAKSLTYQRANQAYLNALTLKAPSLIQ